MATVQRQQQASIGVHAPQSGGTGDADTLQLDRVVGWLLDGLDWGAQLFHVGQYCGRWKASTAGHAQASFHLILEGRCWLHMPGRESVALMPRDGVFLMRDVPHFLSPYSDPGIDCRPVAMQALAAGPTLGATALACGFFSFEGPLRTLVADVVPESLVLRGSDASMAAAASLFDLMLLEARRTGTEPSAVMDRLTGLLFFYAFRHVAQSDPGARGLWLLLRRPGFAGLVADMLQAPAHPWSVDDMARRVHLSRAAFFRQFGEACGRSPLQFLLLLRMQVAARQLEQGESIGRAAEAVGYESYAAFSRAFKRVIGEQPGAWQRARSRDPRGAAATATADAVHEQA
ncbi:DNA-binding domain-containing protein, AraC-type [Acidovorax sp. CF316]|uniref:AraC family transcriptional regulator n=1 Tax=Acidovorax sp. CF316 TaxID=1144317 RepID=UPI00026BEA26|nr:AraC family transcriptional regulator [Acidovorax sp. CF316]EJE50906.1 DNA-binding domain-containing protein, AraC-type [Acidovorax sp. CF316]